MHVRASANDPLPITALFTVSATRHLVKSSLIVQYDSLGLDHGFVIRNREVSLIRRSSKYNLEEKKST